MTSPYEIALSSFQQIHGEFPDLAMELVREPEHVDAELNIPQQPGLLFDVHLNLENVDELHLVVAHEFWVSWFPCTEADVSRRFVEAVCGVLSGAFRILAVHSGRQFVKGYLQEPRGAHWKTIARSYHSFALLFWRRRKTILQNVSAQQGVEAAAVPWSSISPNSFRHP